MLLIRKIEAKQGQTLLSPLYFQSFFDTTWSSSSLHFGQLWGLRVFSGSSEHLGQARGAAQPCVLQGFVGGGALSAVWSRDPAFPSHLAAVSMVSRPPHPQVCIGEVLADRQDRGCLVPFKVHVVMGEMGLCWGELGSPGELPLYVMISSHMLHL